jgi:kynurenine formamidase
MCEKCEPGYGFKGFIDLPKPIASTPAGPWLDLTHKVSPTMPYASIFKPPSFKRLREMPKEPFQVTEMEMVVHAGTHVDSPRHYYLDGPDMADVPLERLYGPGVVWRIAAEPNQQIDVDKLEAARPRVRPGDIVAIDTGWAARVGTEDYEHHPSLTADAAKWLLDQRIKLLACDFATPDLVYHLRKPGFNWPVHHTLLSNGILVAEHLTGHAALAGRRAEFFFGALPIVACDGGPSRVMARAVEGD